MRAHSDSTDSRSPTPISPKSTHRARDCARLVSTGRLSGVDDQPAGPHLCSRVSLSVGLRCSDRSPEGRSTSCGSRRTPRRFAASSVGAVNALDSDRSTSERVGGILDQRHAPQALWYIWIFASSLFGLVLFVGTHPSSADRCDEFHTPPNDLTAWLIFGSVLLFTSTVALTLRRRISVLWVIGGLAIQVGVVLFCFSLRLASAERSRSANFARSTACTQKPLSGRVLRDASALVAGRSETQKAQRITTLG